MFTISEYGCPPPRTSPLLGLCWLFLRWISSPSNNILCCGIYVHNNFNTCHEAYHVTCWDFRESQHDIKHYGTLLLVTCWHPLVFSIWDFRESQQWHVIGCYLTNLKLLVTAKCMQATWILELVEYGNVVLWLLITTLMLALVGVSQPLHS